MKKTLLLLLAFLLCPSMLFSCDGLSKDPGIGVDSGSAENSSGETVPSYSGNPWKELLTSDQNSFDEQFLSYLSDRMDGNYMASPISLRYALSLLLEGAEGETKQQLLDAFGVNSVEEWRNYCLAFSETVTEFDSELQKEISLFREEVQKGYVDDDAAEPFRALRVANSVWKSEALSGSIQSTYSDAVSQYDQSEILSFNASNASRLVNAWVDEKTEHLIPTLLPDDYRADNLALLLINALYFKDAWEDPFLPGLTHNGDFQTKDGNTVSKEFMCQTDTFSYYEDETTQMVILPMEGNISMAFVLGDASDFSSKLSQAESCRVQVTIPKIDLETTLSGGEITDFLKSHGVSLAFSGDADFSGMTDAQVQVSDILQKTRLKLDEDGVEAAAVTAVLCVGTAFNPDIQEPKVFTADRPFSFRIFTTHGDEIFTLFAGEIVQ